MPLQDTYPELAGLPSTAFVTGFWTDDNGNLQTVKIPAQFVYGTKWTTGNGLPTQPGILTGDLYLDVTSGDIFSWNGTTNTWGAPITNLINGSLTVAIWAAASPASGQVLYSLDCPWPAMFAADFSTSLATCNVAPTRNAVFSLQKNGTQFGTCTFAIGSTTGVFSTSGQPVSFAVGDVFNIVAPATADTTLAGVRMSLIGASAGTSVGASAILEYSLLKANNLSDLASVPTARTNLGLGSAALLNTTGVLQPSNNLSDVSNVATARSNLGLGTAATQGIGYFLQVGNNLADLGNTTTARANLGLGSAAVLNTGTSGGTIPLLNAANTWSATQTVGYSNPLMALNDTSGTNGATLGFQKSGTAVFALKLNNSSGVFTLDRYVSGAYVDSPISVLDSSGAVSIPDGLTVGTSLVSNGAFGVTNTTDSTSGGSGSISTLGGLGVTKSLFVGGVASAVGFTNTGTLTGFPGRLINVQTFTSSGTYTKSAGVNSAVAVIVGAGGAGGGAPASSSSTYAMGSGGGGGGTIMHYFSSVSSGAVTVGTGGTGSAGGAGTAGGSSSFGGLTAGGGGGATAGTTYPTTNTVYFWAGVGSGGTASGGNIANIPGVQGNSSFSNGASQYLGSGGSTPYANIPAFYPHFGSSGGGEGGSGHGSGGAGASNAVVSTAATTGGTGAGGLVIIYEYS